jgi:hypothetical protein
MGFGGDIYPRACLHVGPVGISSRPIFTKRSGRENLDVPFLPVSSNDSVDGSAERDDLFGSDRHGDTALSRGVSTGPGSTARFSGLAVGL